MKYIHCKRWHIVSESQIMQKSLVATNTRYQLEYAKVIYAWGRLTVILITLLFFITPPLSLSLSLTLSLGDILHVTYVYSVIEVPYQIHFSLFQHCKAAFVRLIFVRILYFCFWCYSIYFLFFICVTTLSISCDIAQECRFF